MSHATCHLLCALALALACAAPLAFSAAEKKAERTLAAPALSSGELKAVHELFERLSAAFRANDAGACLRLFAAGLPERERIRTGLEQEFEQSRYLAFEVAAIWPDDKLSAKVHSVDVLLRYERVDSSHAGAKKARPQDADTLKDSNTYTFAVQKLDDGSFALGYSQFFDTLGLHRGLGGVPRAVVAALALCALLAFWVWMGWESFRARPRSHFWRAVVVFVPLLGASAYFLWVYLPRRRKGTTLSPETADERS